MSHLENTYPMASADGGQYGQQRQPGTWHPNLIPTHSQGPNFSAPGPAGSDPTQHYQFYPQAADTRPNIAISATDHLGGRSPSSQLSLNLNLSSLSVASPSHASPINPSPSSCLSPATPISPAGNPFSSQSHQFHFDAPQQTQAQASAGTNTQTGSSPTIRQYDEHGMVNSPTPSPYDAGSHNANAPTPGTGGVGSSARRTPGPSRSSSTSSLSQPTQRDRGFSNPSSTTTLVEEETMYDDGGDAAMDLGGDSGYDDMDSMRNSFGTGTGGNGGSPVNGNGSNSGAEDAMGNSTPSAGANLTNGNQLTMNTGGVGGSMGVLGKPIATNNFVTKLFQMINDPKSAHYISWTELGTSFVVSNVGEFSRSILGSHFKHNNFSSFVRQLNMYGFHKINRTPRAQRTSTDAQTWEFSHTKFLRGRPDLLDEIKRKALEPDPAIKHRVELPGEVAAQLGSMREENKRLWEELQAERKHREKLSQALSSLWKGLANRIPDLPMLPPDLTDMDPTSASGSGITSPSASGSNSTITTPGRFQPPPLTMNIGMHNMSTISSPAASPTTTDFPENNPLHHQLAHHHQHQMSHQNSPSFAQHPHQHQIVGAPGNITLSRHNSFQHMPGYMGGVASSPSPSASGPMDMFDDSMSGHDGARVGSKRQRLSDDEPIGTPGGSSLSSPVTSVPPGGGLAGGMPGVVNTGLGGIPNKKMSRARSDSAPLGYGFGNPGLAGWGGAAGVGTGVVGRPRSGSGLAGRGIPSYGGMNRNFIGTPGGSMLSGGSNGGSGTGTPLSGIPMNAPSR